MRGNGCHTHCVLCLCVLATQMLERNGSVLLSAATAHPLPPSLGDAMADGDDPHAPAVAARAKWLDACVAVHRIAVHMMG